MLRTKKVVNSEYQFVRCLGEGLSSVVYEALRSNASGIASERVAVKVLKSENSVSWLQNEFETLRKVNSPNCVRVLGHESFDDGAALILEFIEGVNLFDLGKRFRLSTSEINQIESQVIEGLHAIADSGSFHGDLNPKNVLITCEGRVKLIDFGSFIDSKSLIGSVPYISDQIWKGKKHTLETDLQSWRLIRLDLLSQFTAVPQFEGEAKKRALLRSSQEVVGDSQRTDDSFAVKTISEKVCKIIQQCCSIQTAVLSGQNHRQNLEKKKLTDKLISVVKIASVFAFGLFPAQNLLSEPLKSAGVSAPASVRPASVLIRTRQWTEVFVNGVSKGYSPVTLSNLSAGEYRIKYKRPRGAGELTLLLNPGQKRVLKDADFKD